LGKVPFGGRGIGVKDGLGITALWIAESVKMRCSNIAKEGVCAVEWSTSIGMRTWDQRCWPGLCVGARGKCLKIKCEPQPEEQIQPTHNLSPFLNALS
jgi:hypothetical protein